MGRQIIIRQTRVRFALAMRCLSLLFTTTSCTSYDLSKTFGTCSYQSVWHSSHQKGAQFGAHPFRLPSALCPSPRRSLAAGGCARGQAWVRHGENFHYHVRNEAPAANDQPGF